MAATTMLRLKRRTDGYYTTVWFTGDGRRFARTFGRSKTQAQDEFSRFHVLWQRDPRVRDPDLPPALTIRGAWDKFKVWTEAYYRRQNGTPTGEAINFQHATRELLDLYGDMPAEAFGPLQLKRVREAMIDADLARTVINARVRRIRQFYRWLVSESFVPESTWSALRTMLPLEEGRELVRDTPGTTTVRESDPVTPVPEPYIWAACDKLPPTLAAMVRVQYWSGARPDEVCSMRAVEIDMRNPVWLYYPSRHKTSRKKKGRVIALGPQAQAVLKPYLNTAKVDAYVFSPLAALRERHERCETHRHQPVKSPRTARRIQARYTAKTYGRAIARACTAADIPGWSPNQLRHNAATRVAERHGLEVAAAVLGHARVETTQLYAPINVQKAVAVMLAEG